MSRTPVRRCASFLAALAVLVAAGVAGGTGASAHSVLLATSPSAGAQVEAEPTEVVLTFNEAISGLGAVVRVSAPSGLVSQGRPRVIDHTVHQTLTPAAGGGRYRVDWHVTSADGHPVSDTFTFEVAGPVGTVTPSSSAPSSSPDAAAPGSDTATHDSFGAWALVGLVVVLTLVGIGLTLPFRHRPPRAP